MELRLKNVRIAFPALDEPAAFGEGDPAYQAKFIIEPKSENTKLLDDAMAAVALGEADSASAHSSPAAWCRNRWPWCLMNRAPIWI